ncbi:hypothetical protein [Citrobacter braakii]
MQPDPNVACLTQEHGINDNLLFNLRHQLNRGNAGSGSGGERAGILY